MYRAFSLSSWKINDWDVYYNIQMTNNFEKAVKQSDVIRSQTDLDANQDL